MMWPRDLTDPWLEGPAVLPTDNDAMRMLVEAGMPADERGAA